jgi:hypothetical protein
MVRLRALSHALILDAGLATAWLQSKEGEVIPLQRLDGPTRAKVLSALAGLVILGVGMVALIWLGARVTRRYMNPMSIKPKRRLSSAPNQDDWATKPLVPDDFEEASKEADS